MLKTKTPLLACALLFSGCSLMPRPQILPDPNVPHQVAAETTVTIWARRPDGQLVQQPVRVLPGWWIASPQVVGK